jgi:hypothetical protein
MVTKKVLIALAYASLLLGTFVIVGLPSDATAEDSSVVGVWRLVSVETVRPNGEVLNQWKKKNPVGLIWYDSTGIMSVQFLRNAAPKLDSGIPMEGTPEEIRAAYEGYPGYFGSYYVNEKEGSIVHHVSYGLSLREAGTDYKRFFKCGDNCLVLTTPVFQWNGEKRFNQITLERAEK